MSGGQGMVNKCAKCAWSGYRPGKKTCQTGMLERERGLLKCPNYRGNSFIMWVVCVEPLEYISKLDISNSVSSKIYIRTGLDFKILDYSKCHQ